MNRSIWFQQLFLRFKILSRVINIPPPPLPSITYGFHMLKQLYISNTYFSIHIIFLNSRKLVAEFSNCKRRHYDMSIFDTLVIIAKTFMLSLVSDVLKLFENLKVA